MARVTFPFGPQHPVLPEPVQLILTCEDEKVVEVKPRIGYMHRGIEKGCELNPYKHNVFLCERICGICSFIHAEAYCEVIEKAMGIEVPPRAKYLRVFWAELSRMHSHLLWLGLFADGFGLESLFMQCWRARELVLDVLELTSGHRVIQSTCVVGGVRKDLDPDQIRTVREMLKQFKELYTPIFQVFQHDRTIKSRTWGKGILPKDVAWQLGAVGPTIRGSGWAFDARMDGYAAYGELGFEPVVEEGCDSYARMMVRAREVWQSWELVNLVLDRLPAGEINVPVEDNPKGEAIHRAEQPRGEVIYYCRGDGSPNLKRLKVRTPSFANLPTLLVMLPGCELADVPVITLSIDPCIACTER
ncbi:NADH-ubiquinone oxidoreductase chain 49kDa [Ammonifex degensii KC4]|uniref:NADH-ubiquinone oxidoreductase chain 49kDa n=1 Tax=Ammonifex degensii (strain DSM 10501 / KC4) TaxID=429009 RepID=C9RBS4_AMMDK|nr:nickel-dependent hydrogenase large subunit [Ammonifex degensii]ACX51701.1 NADH-ubiquinone oxidoreductase chain 49kDa [Ammonifex degensii KC4]